MLGKYHCKLWCTRESTKRAYHKFSTRAKARCAYLPNHSNLISFAVTCGNTFLHLNTNVLQCERSLHRTVILPAHLGNMHGPSHSSSLRFDKFKRVKSSRQNYHYYLHDERSIVNDSIAVYRI